MRWIPTAHAVELSVAAENRQDETKGGNRAD